MFNSLKERIAVTRWDVLPAPVWSLIASPLLSWSFGGGPLFTWPVGRSKNPLRCSFWYVAPSEPYHVCEE